MKYSFDQDMLGVLSWIIRKGQFETPWLMHMFEEVSEDNISEHIADIAMDMIRPSDREMFHQFIDGTYTLTDEDKRTFRDLGFFYGVQGNIPKAIKDRCVKWNKFLNQLE